MRLSRVLARSQQCIAPRIAVRYGLASTQPIQRRLPASISRTPLSITASTSRARPSSSSSTSTAAARPFSCSTSSESGVIGAGALSLDEILARARASLGHGDDESEQSEGSLVLLSGDGRHLGSDVSWKLLFDLNDDSRRRRRRRLFAFREDIAGANLSFCWGFDGGGGGDGGGGSEGEASSWEVDERGVAKKLELDDHEALILAAAVRTGWWARKGAGGLIERTVVAASSTSSQLEAPPSLRLRLLHGGLGDDDDRNGGGGRVEATLTLADAESCLPSELSTPLCGGRERWRFEKWQSWPEAKAGKKRAFPARTTHESPSGGMNEFLLRSASEVLPAEEEGEGEREEETSSSSSSLSSDATTAFAVGGRGGSRQAVVAAVAAEAEASTSDPASPSSLFSCPVKDSLRPGGASYAGDSSAPLPCDVPAWWSASGHLLVRPSIDGRPAPGLFLVDSGASGFVIEKEAADELGLSAFGELYVAGVAGSVRSTFRRGRSLSLGPLELASPLFMEMPVAGVVTGGPTGGRSMRAVGILGHDLFRSAVLTLPKRPSSASSRRKTKEKNPSSSVSFPTTATPTRLRLDDPLTYRAPSSAKGRWCDLRFVSNLPHIQATMPLVRRWRRGGGREEEEVDSTTRKRKERKGDEEVVEERSILLMVDSGAGGADVMFHSRAAEELGLLDDEEQSPARVVRGVGTGATSPSPSSSSSNSSSSPSSHLNITATPGTLPWLTLGPVATFGKPVRTLAFSPPGGLDLSVYSSGIACADLLSRARVVVDYPRRRIALIPPPGAAAAASATGAARDARAPRRGIPRGKNA